MKRNISLEEITDGKQYHANDMVKADCGGCNGCSACCHGMGNSIVLDPLDIFNLTCVTHQSFEALLSNHIELNVADGMILPNLKMVGEKEQCSFLSEEGRCMIHTSRPGICRLFPLGRVYEDGSFYYVLQIHECLKEERSKVKVRKWLDIPNLNRYEQFVADWHYFLKELQSRIKTISDETVIKKLNLYVLQQFYIVPFDSAKDFYEQFEERFEKAKSLIA